MTRHVIIACTNSTFAGSPKPQLGLGRRQELIISTHAVFMKGELKIFQQEFTLRRFVDNFFLHFQDLFEVFFLKCVEIYIEKVKKIIRVKSKQSSFPIKLNTTS